MRLVRRTLRARNLLTHTGDYYTLLSHGIEQRTAREARASGLACANGCMHSLSRICALLLFHLKLRLYTRFLHLKTAVIHHRLLLDKLLCCWSDS